MSYSPDGEWLAGGIVLYGFISWADQTRITGAADTATHKIYIWDISNDGQFASALDGGREPLLHLHVRVYVVLLLMC
jgi:COMPASS component SWD1